MGRYAFHTSLSGCFVTHSADLIARCKWIYKTKTSSFSRIWRPRPRYYCRGRPRVAFLANSQRVVQLFTATIAGSSGERRASVRRKGDLRHAEDAAQACRYGSHHCCQRWNCTTERYSGYALYIYVCVCTDNSYARTKSCGSNPGSIVAQDSTKGSSGARRCCDHHCVVH